jgi:hypothetical protein
MRVVTFDCTRFSFCAALITPPSVATVRKMSKLSRSMLLIA